MRTYLLALFALIAIGSIQAQDISLNKKQVQLVQRLVQTFKTNDKAKIAAWVSYPLRREYPLKSIQNQQALVQRFTEVFDAALIKQIAQSKMSDWAEVGWRGIMLDNGTVWINESGKIFAINHQTANAKQALQAAIAADKAQLPPSLQNFERPLYQIQTKTFSIRIDVVAEGKYRYAAWKSSNAKGAPELVLTNGEMNYDGTGGNHSISFKKDGYTYQVYIFVIGAESNADASLEVSKQGKLLLSEDGMVKRH